MSVFHKLSLQDYVNEDAYFGDISIAAPPVVEFGNIIPPVESASESRSSRITFDPLPDLAARRRQQTLVGSDAHWVNKDQLRPKISKVDRERSDSVGSIEGDKVQDLSMEMVKLDRLVGKAFLFEAILIKAFLFISLSYCFFYLIIMKNEM